MARLWFLRDLARDPILETLHKIPHAHVLDETELVKYSIDFEDHMYGQTILLMDPGWQIAPGDMGLNALPAMHGFAPEHKDSYAALLSSDPVDIELNCVDDYFRLMTSKMDTL
jgi:hypothetical protein